MPEPSESRATVKRRQKLLYLMKILNDYTDDRHGLTLPEIRERLSACGIEADRKALYNDIEALRDFGIDIQAEQGRSAEYRVIEREFGVSELKMLADAVSSAKFITSVQSVRLIEKLGSLCSRYEKEQLRRSVFVTGRKSIDPRDGRNILTNVDYINEAINTGKKLSFRYFSYDAGKKKRYHDSAVRTVSPYNLVLNNEQYYLIAARPEGEAGELVLRNYRVDRMERLSVSDESADPRPKDYSVESRVDEAFSMFSGEAREVRLRFSEELMGPVMDKFGTGVRVYETTDGTDARGNPVKSFVIRVMIRTSGPFFGWLFQFGGKAEILSPPDIRDEYADMCREVLASIEQGESKNKA